MNAIEFEAPIRDGMIPIPARFRREIFPVSVRVIILSETTGRTELDASALERRKAAFRRLDGCLAGVDVTLEEAKAERLARQ